MPCSEGASACKAVSFHTRAADIARHLATLLASIVLARGVHFDSNVSLTCCADVKEILIEGANFGDTRFKEVPNLDFFS
jgi:hypothetical protein